MQAGNTRDGLSMLAAFDGRQGFHSFLFSLIFCFHVQTSFRNFDFLNLHKGGMKDSGSLSAVSFSVTPLCKRRSLPVQKDHHSCYRARVY